MENRLEALLSEAIHKKISDIHFTLKKDILKIEFRHQMKLIEYPSSAEDKKLLQFLQYKANLQMGQIASPQSGQFEMIFDDHHISLRFSILHSYGLTNGVLRILNHALALRVDSLSMNKKDNELFTQIGYYDFGLVLIGGPTSSGKTSTLYTILEAVKHRRIFTIEDPIEILNDHYVQLQVNHKTGFDYETGIRQLLRHDPDIIMIGEIRDKLTAMSAIRAALTGHLVLATIHAFNGLGTIKRMEELCHDKTMLQAVLKLVINQRLVLDDQDNRKVALYEIVSKQKLDTYFKTENLPKLHQDIQTIIRKAIKNQKISAKTLFE